jgi:site-specific DNA-methyltransferase (adenine-specific)
MNWKEKLPKENIYYENENGILYKGDCLEILKNFKDIKFDAIITDPPYQTTKIDWDKMIPLEEMWKILKSIRNDETPIVLFGDEPFSSYLRLSNIKEYKYDLIWKKQKPTNFFQLKRRFGKVTEYIHIFYKKQCKYNPQKFKVEHRVTNSTKKNHNSITAGKGKKIKAYKDDGTRYPINILEFNRVDESKYLHPTQKPLELMKYLIKTYTDENDIVLDFTCGSGTTLLACQNLNRKWIGIELNEEYCKIAKNRLSNSIF